AAGLLDVEYRRPPGRGGPGAGRPAKLYRRSRQEFSASVPDRHYELAGRLLAESVAVAHAEGSDPVEVMQRVTRAHGVAVGGRQSTPRRAGPGARRAVLDALGGEGYQPAVEGRTVVLANCPFHRLVDVEREIICGMNLAFVSGIIEGMGVTGVVPCLRPAPDRCCVVVDT
ncbi:MAG TPA: transcriptional regulator, partial [Acidimicrobiales bacterium]|nr:transcriptional regulator [Acidimicrobiales bacterium]